MILTNYMHSMINCCWQKLLKHFVSCSQALPDRYKDTCRNIVYNVDCRPPILYKIYNFKLENFTKSFSRSPKVIGLWDGQSRSELQQRSLRNAL